MLSQENDDQMMEHEDENLFEGIYKSPITFR